MVRILFAAFFTIVLTFLGCQGSTKNYSVEYVERNALFSLDRQPNSPLLVIEIDENGKLSLNKIQTGTISDLSELSEKIKVVLDDRERAGAVESEVVIYPQGKVNDEDLEKLIESLGDLKALPIRVIKNKVDK